MPIVFESELMENQKHADVMAPDIDFDVLQTDDGNALHFSIGTDGVFYLTQEMNAQKTGWLRQDLSSALAAQLGAASVTATAFSISQNAATGNIDLALSVQANGSDTLFLSLGNTNTVDAWGQGVTWTAIPYDDAATPMPVLSIADLYILQTPQGEFFVADILAQPGATTSVVYRYYLTPGASQQWNPHDLAGDFSAGSVQSCLGQRTGDLVAGIYTFGTIAGETQLLFTPLFNPFNPNVAPSPVRLTMPQGATAIAAATGADGTSFLFVAAGTGLYVFAPDSQADMAIPVALTQSASLAGVRNLRASTGPLTTAVWGINGNDELFSISCPLGSETDVTAWTLPFPILDGVENAATYLNGQAGNSVIFAHTQGANLTQLRQDPVSSVWSERSILLPSTDMNSMYSFQSFTTHIQVTDAYNGPLSSSPLTIAASSQVAVYLNDVYYVLSPSDPVSVTTDVTGVMTVVQEVGSLAAVCLQVTYTTTGESASINPMVKMNATLATVQSGADLSNVTVTNADGTTQSLVPAGTSTDDVNAAATSIQQLVAAGNSLPQNGSPATPSTSARKMLGDANGIEVVAGDFLRWLRKVVHKVEQSFIKLVDGVQHFFVQIGEDIYHFALDCLNTVAHAMEYVFNKIKVAFEDAVKWLGFIFSWNDILRTHNVLSSIFLNYTNYALGQISSAQAALDGLFANVENAISQWAGLTGDTTTVGGYQQQQSNVQGSNSPQSNWALHHAKSNVSSSTTNYAGNSPDPSIWTEVIAQIKAAVEGEVASFETAVSEIKTQVYDERSTLTASQMVTKLAGIIGNFIVKTVRQILDLVLQIVVDLVQGAENLLTSELHIPILSKLYQDIAKKPLTVLDLGCLICAIPATVIYKIVKNAAPYPDTPATAALINATDFATIQSLLAAPAAAPHLLGASSGPTPLGTAYFALGVCAFFGSMFVAFTSGLKFGQTDSPSKALRVASVAAYAIYLGPNYLATMAEPQTAWYNEMNDVLTYLSLVKVIADNASPFPFWDNFGSPITECLINVAWMVPAVEVIKNNPSPQESDWMVLAANMGFDLGGAITPVASESLVKWAAPEMVPAVPVAFAAQMVLGFVYGTVSLVNGMCLLDAD